MNLTRVILIVGGVIFVSNFLLFYLVQKDGQGMIISLAVSIAEVIILGITSWYWMEKSPVKSGKGFKRIY